MESLKRGVSRSDLAYDETAVQVSASNEELEIILVMPSRFVDDFQSPKMKRNPGGNLKPKDVIRYQNDLTTFPQISSPLNNRRERNSCSRDDDITGARLPSFLTGVSGVRTRQVLFRELSTQSIVNAWTILPLQLFTVSLVGE